MDYMLAGMVLFIGAAAMMMVYAHSFKRPAFQLFFYSMSFLLIIAGFVFQLAAPSIQYHTDSVFNSATNITNTTEYYTIPSGTSGILNGMYTNLLFAFLLIMALIMVLFILDSVMLYIGKKSDPL